MNSIRPSRARGNPESCRTRCFHGFPLSREGREPAPLTGTGSTDGGRRNQPPDGDWLLEQQHLSDGVELAAGLQAVEVHPCGEALAVVIRRVPSD